MNFKQVADHYRLTGYTVVEHPEAKDLPDFAKAFKIELVARRRDCSALVSVKNNISEFRADANLSDYAKLIEQQPGWRFDIVVLG